MFQTLTKLEFKLPRNEKGQSFASHLVFLYKFLKFKSETGVQPIYSLGVKICRQRIFNFVDMFFLLQSAKTIKVTNQKITIKNNEGKILTLPRLIMKMDTVHQANSFAVEKGVCIFLASNPTFSSPSHFQQISFISLQGK